MFTLVKPHTLKQNNATLKAAKISGNCLKRESDKAVSQWSLLGKCNSVTELTSGIKCACKNW